MNGAVTNRPDRTAVPSGTPLATSTLVRKLQQHKQYTGGAALSPTGSNVDELVGIGHHQDLSDALPTDDH